MTTKTWNFTLEGKPHTLILEHKWLSGKRSVILDGQLLESIPPSLFASGSVHEYEVDGHSLVAVIQEKPASFAYDLLVDGVSLDTGERGPQRVGNTSLQGAIALAVMIFFIGLGISIWQKISYDKRLAIQEWPVVTGKITSLGVDYHADTNDDDTDDSYYHAILTVNYIVNDKEFMVQLDDDQSYDSEGSAMTAHLVGESQDLYVNPVAPQEAELFYEKLEPNGWIGTVLLIMGMFTILPLIIVVAVWFQTGR